MKSTRDLIYKSIAYEFDSIQKYYLAITKEIESIVELDFFPLHKKKLLSMEYIESLIDKLQKLHTKYALYKKKNQLFMVCLREPIKLDQYAGADNQKFPTRLLELNWFLVERTMRDRMKTQSNVGEDDSSYFEYLMYQLMESNYDCIKTSGTYRFSEQRFEMSLEEYDRINALAIQLLRTIERFPFHCFRYKHQCMQIIIETKNILIEIREKQHHRKKKIDQNSVPPVPWFSGVGSIKKGESK